MEFRLEIREFRLETKLLNHGIWYIYCLGYGPKCVLQLRVWRQRVWWAAAAKEEYNVQGLTTE